jgi:uncharacterized membrane protein YkoI
MKKTIASTFVAGAMAASLALVGCGAQPAATGSKTEEKTTQEQTSSTTMTDATKTDATKTDATKTEATPTTDTTKSDSAAAAQTNSTSQISPDEAKQIALKDAGVAEADARELKVELDSDDPTVHYDVDFKSGGNEFDYDIDVTTGAIIKNKVEVDD